MDRKLAVLRGINVGGKRKILMADLKALCQKLGLKNVATYIQSGNVIFESDKDNTELENELETTINQKFGYEVPVIVRSSKELISAIERNPFLKDSDNNQLHLTFLKEVPSPENQEKLNTYYYPPDQFNLQEKEVFLYCEGKYHQTKLSNNFFEKKLRVGATSRNWKTVLKLKEMLEK